ncbi:MAG: M28 family peptidase [Planctomycetes bacterium]|nr:M28 family peptidase [Planctomycetota bacterium]
MAIIFNEQNAYRLLKQLAFPRLGGTKEEKAAADLLKKYLKSIGLTAKEETFQMQTFKDISASLEVLTPYRKKYKVSVMGNSGSTPRGGIKAELAHFISSAPEELKKAKGKIAITYNAVTKTIYQELRQNNARALIRITGPSAALQNLKQNDLFTKAYGRIPSVLINYEDGLEIVQKGARLVHLISLQKEMKATSRNIIATIPGTEFPNEKIILCAHYDSVNKSPGGVDNAGGSVTIADFASHFSVNKPKRTLIFIWFGSEEMGLKGSWAYAEKHKKELVAPKPPISLKSEEIKLLINLDVAGTVLGNNGAVICGAESMANFIDSFAKEKGIPMNVHHSAYSSDNIPFNEKGIPSFALNRHSGYSGHTPLDGIHQMGPEGLKILGQFGLELVSRIANAVEIPFELKIPEADKKSLYEYVERANPFYKRK